jgi:ABC-2 type transport system permease protein/sodium transport system permease protein
VLGASAWVFVTELTILLYHVGVTPFDPARALLLRGQFDALRHNLPVPLAVALAVVPGVAEEVFFRGYLFSAVRARMNAAGTVVLTALLFGLFHLIGLDGFSLERGLSSTAMGLLLGWLAWRTGSLWPGMLLHGCHNGLLMYLTLAYPPEPGSAVAMPEYHPWPLLAGAGVALATGLALAQMLCRPAAEPQAVE